MGNATSSNIPNNANDLPHQTMDYKRLIERGEHKNTEFKASCLWDGDERPRLTKAIAAMANTQDGGIVLIGIDDDRSSGMPVVKGLTPEQLVSFDPTKVAEYVNQQFEPGIRLRLEKPQIGGHAIVAIIVDEFNEQPHICIKQGVSQGKSCFKPGELLVRTVESQSKVAGPQELRELLGRAITKKSEQLLEQMRRIVTGAPVQASPSWESNFASELFDWKKTEADFQIQSGNAASWTSFVVPTSSTPLEVRTHQKLRETIQKVKVSLRGWDFVPADDSVEIQNNSNCISAHVKYGPERWELFRRLIFGDIRPHFEDQGLFIDRNDSPGLVLSILNINQTVGEFFLFSKRLFEAEGYAGTLELQFKLSGCKGRTLVAGKPNRNLPRNLKCEESEITVKYPVHTTDLAAGWLEHAVKVAQEILSLFNMDVHTPEVEGMIRRDIEQMLSRT